MSDTIVHKDVFIKTGVFSGHFVDSKSYFLYRFDKLPSVTIIRQLDYAKAYGFLKKEYGNRIVNEFHYSAINRKKTKEEKEESVIELQEGIVLEMGDGYCEFYFHNRESALLCELIKQFTSLRGKRNSQPQEIHLITKGDYGLELTKMDVKRTRLDMNLYYEDDFREVHQTVLKRLNKKDDKGIVLLHGLPGTGKTTYLRHLVGRIKKRVLFVPPDLAGQIVNPDLVKLLIENPNSVLVIEDAENIVMQRQQGSDSAVSNLLNISDGLLSDFLNVQVVCTFNSSVSSIDKALMRKGRLIAHYEFGKLSAEKSQKLSKHMGYHHTITEPMTVAEIANQKERSYTLPERTKIGFRIGETGS
ncbi:AAA family ATPase [Chitinophagaceae bacterium MMS25-I14]